MPCLFVAIVEADLLAVAEVLLAEVLKRQKALLVAEGSERRQLPALSAVNPT